MEQLIICVYHLRAHVRAQILLQFYPCKIHKVADIAQQLWNMMRGEMSGTTVRLVQLLVALVQSIFNLRQITKAS